MRPPFRLVPDGIPHDIVEALEHMLHDAKQEGDLIGLAYIGMYRKRRIVVANAAGEFYRSPDAARGYLAHLHDLLGKLARGEPMPPGW
jgi:hypothetical protein